MQVKLLRASVVDGRMCAIGDVVEAPRDDARYLIAHKRAVAVDVAAAEVAEAMQVEVRDPRPRRRR